jgi:hypothetical protein
MKTKITLTSLLLLSLLINLKNCDKTKQIIEYEYITGKKDTLYIKIKDSIKNIKPQKTIITKKEFIKDTVFLSDTVLFFNDTLQLNVFKTIYNDSLINAEISSSVKGILFKSDLKYYFTNKTISSTDTIIKTITDNKNKIYLGAFTDFNSLSPSLLYSYKNNYIFKASYNIHNKNPYLGIYIKIK